MQVANEKSFFIKASPLFLAILIDGAGMGLFFPILNALMMDPHTSILPAHFSLSTKNFLYGFTLSIYMVFWFFGAAILSDVSDGIGRRKSLSICLFGSFVGYLLSALAVIFHSYSLLLLGRIIDGFTAGSQPIAQAAIIDMSPEHLRTRNLGYIMFCASLGFVIGPLLGGVLSDHALVSWFSFSTPLYMAAIICGLTALTVWLYFDETSKATRELRIRLAYAIDLFVSAFRNQQVRYLSAVLFFMVLGWSNYFSFVSLFLLKRYGYMPLEVSIFWAVLAAGYALGFSYLVGRFAKFPPHKVCLVGFLITGLGLLITVLSHVVAVAWVCAFIMGSANGVAYTRLVGMFSSQVDETRQGWVMGITGSVMALAVAISTFVAGFLADVSAAAPLMAGVFAYVIVVVMLFLKR